MSSANRNITCRSHALLYVSRAVRTPRTHPPTLAVVGLSSLGSKYAILARNVSSASHSGTADCVGFNDLLSAKCPRITTALASLRHASTSSGDAVSPPHSHRNSLSPTESYLIVHLANGQSELMKAKVEQSVRQTAEACWDSVTVEEGPGREPKEVVKRRHGDLVCVLALRGTNCETFALEVERRQPRSNQRMKAGGQVLGVLIPKTRSLYIIELADELEHDPAAREEGGPSIRWIVDRFWDTAVQKPLSDEIVHRLRVGKFADQAFGVLYVTLPSHVSHEAFRQKLEARNSATALVGEECDNARRGPS
ncbi:hypothetical protein LTR37_019670 [Vermiconidia calcicola]|uniref:Uncharacterized protein n=1 Tax=Vermiconidia calcicola TaxID=1690605 RepID=A0ACC3MDE4_9PEZI|nr:hypothetical protein LTR37_019670 [Vermiconidia calcicola]